MKKKSLLPLFALLLSLAIATTAQDFDFFYFVQQWPGSYCDTKQSCCYPSSGKPAADFGIHGLWPNYNDGTYPSNCDPGNSYDSSKIKDLIGKMRADWPTLACPSGDGSKFWAHEWEKHGTYSKSILDQHSYFEAALNLKKQVNLLQILQDAGKWWIASMLSFILHYKRSWSPYATFHVNALGITPDGGFYKLNNIKRAIQEAIGFTPGIECNVDESGNRHMYHIYLCVDTSGIEIMECPTYLRSKCSSRVEFPIF